MASLLAKELVLFIKDETKDRGSIGEFLMGYDLTVDGDLSVSKECLVDLARFERSMGSIESQSIESFDSVLIEYNERSTIGVKLWSFADGTLADGNGAWEHKRYFKPYEISVNKVGKTS